MLFMFFFNSVSLRCVFWNILAVDTNSQKKLKRHMVFLFCISFIQVLCVPVFFLVWLRCMVPAGPGCENEVRKKGENATWFSFFFIVSHSGVGFWKVLVLGLFFASHSAVGFWKVLAVEMNAQKQLKIDVLESSGCENQLTKSS